MAFLSWWGADCQFKKNAFEDIWVDGGGKPLATGTKYRPKQMKFRKHAM